MMSLFLTVLFFLFANAKVSVDDLNTIGGELFQIFEEGDGDDDEHFLPANIIRLAFHDAGTYSHEHENGGSHAVQFFPCPGERCEHNDRSNSGLARARAVIETLHDRFDETMSKADLAQFAANVAIEFTDGPRIPFCYGRADFDASASQLGRLPKGSFTTTEQIYSSMGKGRLGLSPEEIVAVLGAHTVGHMHREASGNEGPWDTTPRRWDNEYYKELMHVFSPGWFFNEDLNQFEINNRGGRRVMLQADAALMKDPTTRAIVQRFARNQRAWMNAFQSGWKKIQLAGHSDLREPETHRPCSANHDGGADPEDAEDDGSGPGNGNGNGGDDDDDNNNDDDDDDDDNNGGGYGDVYNGRGRRGGYGGRRRRGRRGGYGGRRRRGRRGGYGGRRRRGRRGGRRGGRRRRSYGK